MPEDTSRWHQQAKCTAEKKAHKKEDKRKQWRKEEGFDTDDQRLPLGELSFILNLFMKVCTKAAYTVTKYIFLFFPREVSKSKLSFASSNDKIPMFHA